MKKLVTLAIVLIVSSTGIAQQEITFSDPVSVSGLSTEYGKHLPRIGSLADGTIVVFWSKGGSNPAMYLSKLQGEVFGEVVEIPTGNLVPDVWFGTLGPAFTCYENRIFIVFEIWGQGIYLVRSTDGGSTFEDPITAYTPLAGRVATLPAITVDNNGNPLIGFITTNTSEQDALYEVVISGDGGSTFGDAVVANQQADGGEVCECCPSSLAVSVEGELFVSFRNNNSNVRDIWISRSIDNGQSFPAAYDVDATDWIIQGCPSTGPHTVQNGDSLISVFFSGSADWDAGVYLSTLMLDGYTAGDPVKLPHFEGSSGLQNYPRISAQQDTLGVIWHEHTGVFYNIALAVSTDGVAGLSTVAINPTNANNPQVYPDIHYAGGKFHFVYEDQATGTVLYQTVDFQTSTGIDPAKKAEQKVEIYPNPADDYIHVVFPATSSRKHNLEIYDGMGRLLHQQILEGSEQFVDIRDFDKGFYFLKIASAGILETKTIIVK